MIDLGALIERHGWHVIAELAVLAVVTVFTAIYLAALLRGKVRAHSCPSCGRVVSRADPRCPRCGTALEPAPEGGPGGKLARSATASASPASEPPEQEG